MRRICAVLLISFLTVACSSSAVVSCPAEGQLLETAKLYIEHNSTDDDTGVHGLFGGTAWSSLCVWDPAGELILTVDPQAQFDDLAVSDFFFESREPTGDVYPLDTLFAAFPEGTYRVGGTDFEGRARTATATFTHDIPAPPVITSPALADEESAAEVVVPMDGMTVTWDPVTMTLDGSTVTITGYEVIVTKVDHDDPNGMSQPIYDVHVGPDVNSLSVPVEFLESGAVYELEVLALEVSGNQTISLGFFTTG